MVSKTLFCRKCKWFCRSTGWARMTGWGVLVQFTLYCDLSISFSNAITKFKGSSPCYGRCRYIARIIPDTRPSGSLRSRKIAPGDFFPPAGEDDGLGVFVSSGAGRAEWGVVIMTSYRQGWRANCIQGRRSRMDKPNNGEITNSRHSRRSCLSFPPSAGMMNN